MKGLCEFDNLIFVTNMIHKIKQGGKRDLKFLFSQYKAIQTFLQNKNIKLSFTTLVHKFLLNLTETTYKCNECQIFFSHG